MIRSFKKILAVTALFLAVTVNGLALADEATTAKKPTTKSQKTRSFYVKSREPNLPDEQNELCRVVARILDEPENKRFTEIGFAKNAEFTIPKKYEEDFSFPEWTDVPREDLTKYVKSEKWLSRVTHYEKLYKDNSVTTVLQKTDLDLDRDGKNEEILRVKFSNHIDGPWACYVSDMVETVVTKSYNLLQTPGRSCHFFKYKGQIFQTESHLDYLSIKDPGMVTQSEFGMYTICRISLTPLRAKVVEKAVEKLWAEDDKKNKAALSKANSTTPNSETPSPTN